MWSAGHSGPEVRRCCAKERFHRLSRSNFVGQVLRNALSGRAGTRRL